MLVVGVHCDLSEGDRRVSRQEHELMRVSHILVYMVCYCRLLTGKLSHEVLDLNLFTILLQINYEEYLVEAIDDDVMKDIDTFWNI